MQWPWALSESRGAGRLNWPLIGVIALDGLAWALILSFAVPLLSRTLS